MVNETRTCKTCKYVINTRGAWVFEKNRYCRRYPPDSSGRLATTTLDNWCGEYIPQQQQEETNG